MEDLAALYPQVASVSVVPVELTKYRRAARSSSLRQETAAETVKQVNGFGSLCLEKYGSRIFFCADEVYLKTGLPIPDDDYYEGWPQRKRRGHAQAVGVGISGRTESTDHSGSGRMFPLPPELLQPVYSKLLMTLGKCYKIQEGACCG